MFITGYVSASWYGWPMIFYLTGLAGILWVLAFAVFGYDSPAVHPYISKAEKYYIEASLGHTDEKTVSSLHFNDFQFKKIGFVGASNSMESYFYLSARMGVTHYTNWLQLLFLDTINSNSYLYEFCHEFQHQRRMFCFF